MDRIKKPELLAPAGSYETFLAVLNAGADAVYLGGGFFGARAYAGNLTDEELFRAIDYAHIHGRKLYLTVNTLCKEQELEERLLKFLEPYYRQGLDAVIVQDYGVLRLIRQEFPGLLVHASTQMSIAGRYGAELLKELGVSRIVTARELSYSEIRDIADHVEIEIESFIHGALCYCYSGQCLLSSMLGGRSGNRGRCAQPCRLPYEVYSSKRGKIKTDGSFLLSPKDLCTIENLPKVLACGVTSLKIEGRMKQAEYAAGVVSVYRRCLDTCLENGQNTYKVLEQDKKKLYDFGNRSGFTDGYYGRKNGKSMITFQKPGHTAGNEALWKEIRAAYIGTELKEKINGKLILNKGFPAVLELYFNNIAVTAQGDLVQKAEKQPLTEEKAAENIKKTGNTPFVFEKLDILMEKDVFLPVGALNRLRRDALCMMSEQALASYRRTEPETRSENGVREEKEDESKSGGTEKSGRKEILAASIEERDQLLAVLSYPEITDIYLDCLCYGGKDWKEALKADIARIKAAKKRAYYILPAVFRKKTAETYEKEAPFFSASGLDGMVVKSYDAIWFVKKRLTGMEFLIDQSLYSYNNRAVFAFLKEQPLRITAPFELNRKELEVRRNEESEIVIYGRLPLMTSAQCVLANTEGCKKKSELLYLKDRYGKQFPVKNNCVECINTIYNSVPLNLISRKEELKRIGFSAFRLSFTIEKKEQIAEIMQIYRNVSGHGKTNLMSSEGCQRQEFTSGHYKRGVE